MSDAYWMYGDARQQAAVPALVAKRPRTDYGVPGGQELPNYYARENDGGAQHPAKDTDAVNASYDRYLHSMQVTSYGVGDPARSLGTGLSGHAVDDPRIMSMGPDPTVVAQGNSVAVGGGRPEFVLPPDASSTLFVEGLPVNCTRREVSHIFRPFVGYKEVRLVTKESKHSGGDPFVLCFVDFASPLHAATVMDALQGYKFDEDDPDSVHLRLQFARYPGARSGGRGRR